MCTLPNIYALLYHCWVESLIWLRQHVLFFSWPQIKLSLCLSSLWISWTGLWSLCRWGSLDPLDLGSDYKGCVFCWTSCVFGMTSSWSVWALSAAVLLQSFLLFSVWRGQCWPPPALPPTYPATGRCRVVSIKQHDYPPNMHLVHKLLQWQSE